MENLDLKAKDVFFKALKNNNTNEYDIHPHLKAKFEIFCQKMVNENPNEGIDLFYDVATKTFRLLRDNPDSDIPEISIE